ncbi:helix-turn-helix transcriptional regulator [Thiorhodococcus mannitoliphagus]|nr:WYL domain-containing protein [Thiorhodococcus mannitoliphagus]
MSRIEELLPASGATEAACRDAKWLLQQLEQDGEIDRENDKEYFGDANPDARLRALQRDLKEMVREKRIETANPKAKPLRYRRCPRGINDDSTIWSDTVRQVRNLVDGVLKTRQLDRLWQQLPVDDTLPLLTADRLRILPDTLRLLPPVANPEALSAVITALAKGYALDVTYENAYEAPEIARKNALLHPQAVVQRGPVPYLFALKNDEDDLVRTYALQRMVSATALPDVPARRAEHFDLDEAIANGKVDFGQGEMIELKLLVRGYMTRVLLDCPLSADQDVDDEPDDPEFEIGITATVPSTGQLLRWLLGAGDKLKVVGPEELRHTVEVQAAKMARLYNQMNNASQNGHSASRSV